MSLARNNNNNNNTNEFQPMIQVAEIVDHDDGTCTVKFETNDAFDKMYLEETGKKRVTKRGLSNYIKDIIIKAHNKQDGYDIKKI